MAKPWADVAASSEFKALPPDQQDAARGQYFDSVVAPKVPKASLDMARQQFDAQTKLTPAGGGSPPAGTPTQAAPDKEYVGSILPFARNERTGETRLAMPTMLQGLLDTAKSPGDVYTGKIKPGSPEAVSAAQNFAGSIAGGSFAGGKAMRPVSEMAGKAMRPVSEMAQTGKQLGLDVGGKLNPDTFHPELMRGIGQAEKGVSQSIAGGAPLARNPSELAKQGGAILKSGAGAQQRGVQDLYTQAQLLGENVPVAGDSPVVKEMVHAIGEAPKEGTLPQPIRDFVERATGEKTASTLSGQDKRITSLQARNRAIADQQDVLKQRDEYVKAREASITDKSASTLQEKVKLEREQLNKAFNDNRRAERLLEKDRISLDNKLNLERKAAKTPKPLTGRDLISFDRELSTLKYGARGTDRYEYYDRIQNVLRGHIDQMGEGNALGNAYKSARRSFQEKEALLGGETAKSLGVSDKLLDTLHRGVGEGAQLDAALAGAKLPQKINETTQVDWTKKVLENNPKAFRKLMGETFMAKLKDANADPERLAELRPLLDHITQAVGDKQAPQMLDHLGKAYTAASYVGGKAKLLPPEYRNAKAESNRLENALKAVASVWMSGGKPTAFGVAKGGQALGINDTTRALRLKALQKQMQNNAAPMRLTPGTIPGTIPGAAVGAAVGAALNPQEQQ